MLSLSKYTKIFLVYIILYYFLSSIFYLLDEKIIKNNLQRYDDKIITSYNKTFREIVKLHIGLYIILYPMICYYDYPDKEFSYKDIPKLIFGYIIYDLLYYIFHYSCHRYSYLYKKIHKQHHRYKISFALATHYNSIFELVIIFFLFFTSMYIAGFSYINVIIGILVYFTIAILSHSNYKLFTLPYHHYHHKYFKYNFSTSLFYDHIFKTIKT